MNVAAITQKVEESFSGVEKPDKDNFFEVYDPSEPEFLEILEGKDWGDFLHFLETAEFSQTQFYGSMISYMTVEAFYYFTPAYLIFSMNENADTVVYTFFSRLYPQPETYEPDPDPFPQLLELYSDEQRHAIALVVNHCTSDGKMSGGDMLALREFWTRWLD